MTETRGPGKANPKKAENLLRERMERRKQQMKKYGQMEINRLHRAKLSPTQQLQALDARLGAGIGAVRERAKLKKMKEPAKSE